jgi:hypothetical protein
MEILSERPDYFPLFIEFWSYAIRKPRLRGRLAGQFAALRSSSARLFLEGAGRQGVAPSSEVGELMGLLINALANGLAMEKLADPEAVPDALFGDLLVLIFQALQALAQENSSMTDRGVIRRPRESAATKTKGVQHE